jgi:SPP1 gp7 family putative phage head morphogenesis protein
MLSTEQIEQYLLNVYSGQTNLFNLPLNVYLESSSKLLQGVIQGYGGGLADFAIGSPNYELAKKLHLNIYNFSAAKTFQEVRSIQSKIMDDKGYIRSFNDFKKDAEAIFDTYNKNWLKTEYNTAINQSYSANRWLEIQENKDIFKYLRYQTAGDERVRDEHAILDDIVKPVDDPFWNTYYPPNGWSCRCIVVEEEVITEKEIKQAEKAEQDLKELKKENKKEYDKQYPPLFRENVGKTGKVFKETHPYYDVPSKYADLKAKNFDLPIPNNLK